MVAFTWTITTLLTLLAFFTAVVLMIQIHSHYNRMERYYQTDDFYQKYMDDNYDDEEHHSGDQQNNADKVQQAKMLLASMSAPSITFVTVYTTFLAIGLSLYGSTAIVGFMSLRGVYIAPCFSSDTNKMSVGIFGGAIVLFANLLLVCAVILGEVRVSICFGRDRGCLDASKDGQ
jgi:hypothetical protein